MSYVDVSNVHTHFIGLAGDQKPRIGGEEGTIEIGAVLEEIDTGNTYIWIGEPDSDGLNTSRTGRWIYSENTNESQLKLLRQILTNLEEVRKELKSFEGE